jgi:SAM-dependent methyltransferase
MDDPALPVADAERALADLARVHRWVGNHALWRQLLPLLRRGPARQRLLDVGAGNGVVALEARRRAARCGVALRVVGLDLKLTHLVIARGQSSALALVVGDALALPFRDGAVDVSISTYFHHHFDDDDGNRLLAEMRRVVSRAAVIVDIRRSRLGSLFGRAVLKLLRLGPVAGYDGPVSLDQGWTTAELRACLPQTTTYLLHRRWPFRWSLELTAEPPAVAGPRGSS